MDPSISLLKMGGSLTLVLGLMLITAYGAKRFLGMRLGLWKAQPVIQIRAVTSLGAKREIALIEVQEEVLLIGVTPNGISLLTRLGKAPVGGPPSPAAHEGTQP